MSNFATLEVSALDPYERGGLIGSILSDCFSAKWAVEPLGGEEVPARITIAQADGVALSRSQMTPMRLHNQRPEGERKYYVYTADRRTHVQVGNRAEQILDPRDLLVMRSDMPSIWTVDRAYQTSALIFDAALFEELVPMHDAVIGQKVNCTPSLQLLLGGMIEAAWELTGRSVFEKSGPQLGRSFLEMLSAALSSESQTARPVRNRITALDARRAQIQAYISRNFADADLNVRSIAEAMQITPRYMQLAFANDDLTPSKYMWLVRLEAAAVLLREPGNDRSITDIAYACGFNSSSHFSTQFRHHFGLSPSAYREAAMEPQAFN